MIFDRAQNTHRMYEVLCDVGLITTEILLLGRRPLRGPLKTEICLVPSFQSLITSHRQLKHLSKSSEHP